MVNFWIGVASRGHVLMGLEGGYAMGRDIEKDFGAREAR
jgi:hypothetical protein